MPDQFGAEDSVQLFQEHAATTTRSLPFKIAPSTVTALGVFTVLAALGLSIQVGKIREEMKNDPTGVEMEAEDAVKQMQNKQEAPTEEERAKAKEESKAQMEAFADAYQETARAALPTLIEELRSERLGARTQASLTLRETTVGLEALLEEAVSGAALSRRAAVNALSLSSNAPALEAGRVMLQVLRDENDALTREYAAYGLGRFAYSAAHPDEETESEEAKENAESAASESNNGESAEAAAESGEADGEGGADALMTEAIAALREIYETDDNAYVREAALFGLVWTEDLRALEVFQGVFDDQDAGADLRYQAALGTVRIARSMRRTGAPEELRDSMLRTCRKTLTDPNELVRANGALAGGYFRLQALTPSLLAMLDVETEPEWEPRARAAEALGRCYEGKATQRTESLEHIVTTLVLTEAFDPEPAVRWKATEALSFMGYNASDWGRLEILETAPKEALEGAAAHDFWGGGEEHGH